MAITRPAGPAGHAVCDNSPITRDRREIHGDHAGRRERVRQAALEDDVHIHQPVANDRVAEAQRDQRQRKHRKLHPRLRTTAVTSRGST